MSDSWATPGGDGSAPRPTPPQPRVGEADPPPAPPRPPTPTVDAGTSPPPPPPPPRPGPGQAAEVRRIASIPLRPMAISELLDAVFKLLRKVAIPAAVTTVLLLGLFQILPAIGAAEAPSIMEAFNDPEAFAEGNQDPFATLNGWTLVGILLTAFAASWVAPALTWLALRSDDDPLPTAGATIGAGWRWFPRAFGASWLLGLMIWVPVMALLGVILVLGNSSPGAYLLVLPWLLVALPAGIAWYVIGSLVTPVIVIEDLGAWASIRRSWELWRKRFWPLVGFLVVGWIVVQMLAGAVSTPFSLAGLFGLPGSVVFLALGGIVSVMVATPITTFYTLAVYFDTRIRTEGYDVAIQADELR